jgi:hypothetical protein
MSIRSIERLHEQAEKVAGSPKLEKKVKRHLKKDLKTARRLVKNHNIKGAQGVLEDVMYNLNILSLAEEERRIK